MVKQKAGTLFHGSSAAGLKTIEPHVSTHGEAYVYASRDPMIALLFLGKWDDFLLNVAHGDDALLEITERCAGALEAAFEGVGGSLYELKEKNFQVGRTRFDGELVSKESQTVLCETVCSDIYGELIAANERGALRIRRYPDRHPDIPADDSDLVEEALGLFARTNNRAIIERCASLHPHLAERLKIEK